MNRPAYWAVIPAGGSGRRMGAAIPKQYLPLRGRAVIEHTVERLARHPRIRQVVVAVAADDRWWAGLHFDLPEPPLRAPAGAERCHSVLNGLRVLADRADDGDWVLVHDAVRPCVRATDVDRLMNEAADHPGGGLLGVPARDTMKRADVRGEVVETVSREGLWHALTPQMFPLGALAAAIASAVERGVLVTDEAQAMELAGHAPRMVEGHPDNIKITRELDMVLADLYLAHQEREA